VLVVDDGHWADSSTRDLLDFIARRIRRLPLLLLVTYRSDEVHSMHPLSVILDGWRRAKIAQRIDMRTFTNDDVSELVCARLGSQHVDAGFVETLCTRTDGVPFAAEELLEEAIGSGHLVRRDGTWQASGWTRLALPDTLAKNVLRRLNRFEPTQMRVIAAAAVLGRTFDTRLLPALTDLPREVVSTALLAATSAQIFEADSDDRCRLRFRHSLTHEVVRDAVPVWDAANLHGRAADMLSQEVARTDPPPTGRRQPGSLSQRERQLLSRLASGMTDQQIADALIISVRTVRSHLDRIRDKTGRRRRSELTMLAVELGLLAP
jgi:predicted ATPase/DNA-binding CsgD family transcriptional regulator